MPPNETMSNETLRAVVRAVTALGSGLREQQQLQAEQHAEVMRELATIRGAALPQNNGVHGKGIFFGWGKTRAEIDPEHASAVRPFLVKALVWAASSATFAKLITMLSGGQ